MPEETPTAATPPSNAARRCSTTATVGLPTRL